MKTIEGMQFVSPNADGKILSSDGGKGSKYKSGENGNLNEVKQNKDREWYRSDYNYIENKPNDSITGQLFRVRLGDFVVFNKGDNAVVYEVIDIHNGIDDNSDEFSIVLSGHNGQGHSLELRLNDRDEDLEKAVRTVISKNDIELFEDRIHDLTLSELCSYIYTLPAGGIVGQQLTFSSASETVQTILLAMEHKRVISDIPIYGGLQKKVKELYRLKEETSKIEQYPQKGILKRQEVLDKIDNIQAGNIIKLEGANCFRTEESLSQGIWKVVRVEGDRIYVQGETGYNKDYFTKTELKSGKNISVLTVMEENKKDILEVIKEIRNIDDFQELYNYIKQTPEGGWFGEFGFYPTGYLIYLIELVRLNPHRINLIPRFGALRECVDNLIGQKTLYNEPHSGDVDRDRLGVEKFRQRMQTENNKLLFQLQKFKAIPNEITEEEMNEFFTGVDKFCASVGIDKKKLASDLSVYYLTDNNLDTAGMLHYGINEVLLNKKYLQDKEFWKMIVTHESFHGVSLGDSYVYQYQQRPGEFIMKMKSGFSSIYKNNNGMAYKLFDAINEGATQLLTIHSLGVENVNDDLKKVYIAEVTLMIKLLDYLYPQQLKSKQIRLLLKDDISGNVKIFKVVEEIYGRGALKLLANLDIKLNILNRKDELSSEEIKQRLIKRQQTLKFFITDDEAERDRLAQVLKIGKYYKK